MASSRLFLLALWVTVAALPLQADDFGASKPLGLSQSVSLEIVGSAPDFRLAPNTSGALTAVPVAGRGFEALPVQSLAASTTDPIGLDLTPGITWRLDWDGEGTWSPGLVITPSGRSSEPARLEVLPTASLKGKIFTTRGEPIPKRLTARISPTEGALFPPTKIDCQIDGDQFDCEVPAIRHDLRLRAETFISHFRWGLEVSPGTHLDLGTLALHRGASLAGRVAAEDGELSFDSCEIELRPLQASMLPDDEQKRHRHQAVHSIQPKRIEDQGSFHFRGIRPGQYVVAARQPGFAEVRLYPVEVLENAETEIQDPLVLTPPATLRVELNPPLDLAGEPWRVELLERSEIGTGFMEPVVRTTAAEDGSFEQAELAPGSYVLMVLDSRENRQLYRELSLSSDLLLPLELPLVWVEGMASLGSEPLTAELYFGGLFGAERVVLVSDEKGAFAGTLPREGLWEVYVQAEHPEVERSLAGIEVRRKRGDSVAKVELELPATYLEGKVVAEAGDVEGALVRVIDTENGWEMVTQAKGDGSFALHGLPERRIVVFAEKAHASSRQTSLELDEDYPSQGLQLQLEKNRELTGRVVAANGASSFGEVQGVPAARITGRAYSEGKLLLESVHGRTDIDGTFRLQVPAASQRLDLTVFAPGHSLGLSPDVAIESEGPLVLQVSRLGGEIVFDLEEPIDWTNDKALAPVLFFNGVEISSWTLQRWAQINGVRNPAEETRFTIPAMPTGAYTACQLRQFLLPEPLTPTPTCSGGYLTPGGTLYAGDP